MALVPDQEQGFLRRVRGRPPQSREGSSPSRTRSAAIAAILQGGYPDTVKSRYERPENRIADIEQLAVLASRYDSLERLIADLMLAGDVYGVDGLDADDSTDHLVLSTIHQAKGLEWSRVFVPRLVDESFPNARALGEPGGEDEERRIFYVAVTRAMDELYLTYPLTLAERRPRARPRSPGPAGS